MLSSAELMPGIRAIDAALWLEKQKTLVIGDVHLGYEDELNQRGILVPQFQFPLIQAKLEGILAQVQPETIVINGDLKHEFGEISQQEWRETMAVLSLLGKHSKRLVIVKGNHDTILGPIAHKQGLQIVDGYLAGDVYITHGHEVPENAEFKSAKTVVIGHQHPAIVLKEGGSSEKVKCFLVGRLGRKRLIVMPSLCLVTEGADVRSETPEEHSPFLHDLGDFDVWVVADELLHFGKLRDIP